MRLEEKWSVEEIHRGGMGVAMYSISGWIGLVLGGAREGKGYIMYRWLND